jgi:hypothetical protein
MACDIKAKEEGPLRKKLIITISILVILAQIGWISTIGQSAEEKGKTVQRLFVQSAKGVTFDKGKMTLKGANLLTVLFSDRPDRIAGHMATEEMIPLWKEGKDSFFKDPPNAALSIFGEGKLTEVIVELRNPHMKGDDFTYDVRVLKGEMPAKGGLCSLFIDIIGMPLTPMSYAGVARRAWRRW